MRTLICILALIMVSGCADLKYRIKNVNGEMSDEQVKKDWKDCYEFSPNKAAFKKCTDKKGYYPEAYTD